MTSTTVLVRPLNLCKLNRVLREPCFGGCYRFALVELQDEVQRLLFACVSRLSKAKSQIFDRGIFRHARRFLSKPSLLSKSSQSETILVLFSQAEPSLAQRRLRLDERFRQGTNRRQTHGAHRLVFHQQRCNDPSQSNFYFVSSPFVFCRFPPNK